MVLGPGPIPLFDSVSTLGNLKDRSFEEVAEARAAVEMQVIWLAAQRIGCWLRFQSSSSDVNGTVAVSARERIGSIAIHRWWL